LQAIAALVGAADNWLHFLLANERTLARNQA